MDFRFGDALFSTKRVEDNKAGFVGIELYRTCDGETRRVATVIFWDAAGQFFLETFGTDLALGVVERLIAEAKAVVQTG